MTAYGGAQAAPEPEGRLAHKWKVLISVIFGIFMIILDTTVVNVAFRTIQRDYGVSLSDSQWVISIYVLALGITTPMSGFLADRFGIKKIYISGLSLFVFGSLLCGLAPNISATNVWLLVGARALQGIGGGMAQPLASAFLFSTFPPEEQGTALGFFGVSLVVGPALGPILGGYLVDHGLWPWIFFINLPIGVLGITLASLWLRERPSNRRPALDPLGLVTSVVGFGSVLYAATLVESNGWGASATLTWFGVGAVALIAFAIVELFVAKEPLLDLRLFRRPTFLTANLIGYVSVIGLFGAEFLLPIYLQALRGRTALQTGFTLLPIALAAAVMTPLSGKLYDKIGPRVIAMTGFGILMVNTWQLSKIEALTPIPWILFLLALRGIALGMTVQTTFTTALGGVPKPSLARASSLINGTRFIVQSIGVAVLATILASTLTADTKAFSEQAQQTARQTTTESKPFGICETPGVEAANNIPPGVPPVAAAAIKPRIDQACGEYVAGFEKTYRATFFFAGLAMLLAAFMPGWPFAWAGRSAGTEVTAGAH